MKNHTTSLSLSRELWEAGLRVESVFVHVQQGTLGERAEWVIKKRSDINIKNDPRWAEFNTYPALLASELGELLPERIKNKTLTIGKQGDEWTVEYQYDYIVMDNVVFINKNLANCMGSMLLHLIREGLVDVKSLNGEVQI